MVSSNFFMSGNKYRLDPSKNEDVPTLDASDRFAWCSTYPRYLSYRPFVPTVGNLIRTDGEADLDLSWSMYSTSNEGNLVQRFCRREPVMDKPLAFR